MTKKVFALITTFFIFAFSSTLIFAESNMSQEWQSTVNTTGNTMQNIGNGVKDAVNSVVNVGNNVAGGLTNDNTNQNMNTADNNTATATTTRANNNTNNYTATRASATGLNTNSDNLLGLNNTAWTWIIMAITGAIIVSVIYYYGAQFENRTRTNNTDDRE